MFKSYQNIHTSKYCIKNFIQIKSTSNIVISSVQYRVSAVELSKINYAVSVEI